MLFSVNKKTLTLTPNPNPLGGWVGSECVVCCVLCVLCLAFSVWCLCYVVCLFRLFVHVVCSCCFVHVVFCCHSLCQDFFPLWLVFVHFCSLFCLLSFSFCVDFVSLLMLLTCVRLASIVFLLLTCVRLASIVFMFLLSSGFILFWLLLLWLLFT